MIFRRRKTIAFILSLAATLPLVTTAVRADASSEREKQTSGVTPDKTNSSAGEAKREGTGEGRETPAEKAPAKTNSR